MQLSSVKYGMFGTFLLVKVSIIVAVTLYYKCQQHTEYCTLPTAHCIVNSEYRRLYSAPWTPKGGQVNLVTQALTKVTGALLSHRKKKLVSSDQLQFNLSLLIPPLFKIHPFANSAVAGEAITKHNQIILGHCVYKPTTLPFSFQYNHTVYTEKKVFNIYR